MNRGAEHVWSDGSWRCKRCKNKCRTGEACNCEEPAIDRETLLEGLLEGAMNQKAMPSERFDAQVEAVLADKGSLRSEGHASDEVNAAAWMNARRKNSMTDQEREALTLTEALIFARSELHRALLERGSTVGYRASFARINAALAICEEPATTELLSICHGAVVRHGGTGAARYYVCSECGEACGLAAREEPLQPTRFEAYLAGIGGRPYENWLADWKAKAAREDTERPDGYWNLCCECGYITIADSWLALNYNEAHEDETMPYEPRLIPAESDPSVYRCPACGHDHQDNDSGGGVFDGTRESVIAERARLIADGWEFDPDSRDTEQEPER